MIYILDYGCGNIGSPQNLILNLSSKCKIVSEPSQLSDLSNIIIPGIGAFDNASMLKRDKTFVLKILGFEDDEFDEIVLD